MNSAKIKIMTHLRDCNYGQALQGYALCKFLRENSLDAELIDVRPIRHKFLLRIIKNRSIPIVKKMYRCAKYTLKLAKSDRRQKLFNDFYDKFVNLTANKHKQYLPENGKYQRIAVENEHADIYIVGSDQVWNPSVIQPCFFLEFADKGSKKISYAASFGVENIDENLKSMFREKLHDFDFISVREKAGLEILKSIGITDAVQVLDPSFLLNKKYYLELANNAKICKLKNENYVLTYEMSRNSEFIKFAKHLCKSKNLDIVRIKYFEDKGPLEFLKLLRDAEMVVTDSFHGTAFSIILQKRFFVFMDAKDKTVNRKLDILQRLGISNRGFSTLQEALQIENSEIDYETVNKNLEQLAEESVNFLGKSIGRDLKCL